MKTDVWLSFVFGVVFLLISVVFALVAFYLPKPPNPDMVGNFLYVMQVVLAMSAAGVAAVIPGFLSVNIHHRLGTLGTNSIRAGGAIAVFVIVFLVNPRSITLDQMNRRVSFDEDLSRCVAYIPDSGSPISSALESCKDARDYDPERWEPYTQLARIYYWYTDYRKSVENYEKAISLLEQQDEASIRSKDELPLHGRTEFCAMEYGIAMNFVGVANKLDVKSIPDRISDYQLSLDAAAKSLWCASLPAASDDPDPLYIDLVYIKALDNEYIWLAGGETNNDFFDKARNGFETFLRLPGAVTQWGAYHLSCMYAEAAQKSVGQEKTEYTGKARAYLIQSLKDLRSSQSEKVAQQIMLMKCRLNDPDACAPPRGSEPMICRTVAGLVKGDSEIETLLSDL